MPLPRTDLPPAVPAHGDIVVWPGRGLFVVIGHEPSGKLGWCLALGAIEDKAVDHRGVPHWRVQRVLVPRPEDVARAAVRAGTKEK